MNEESIQPIFSQEKSLKRIWKTLGKLDFLGNQTP